MSPTPKPKAIFSGDTRFQTASDVDAPMDVAELCRILNVGPSVARSLMRNGDIRALKVGGQWRTYPRDVAAFITAQLERGGRGAGKRR